MCFFFKSQTNWFPLLLTRPGYCRVRSAVTDVTAAVSKYLSVKILAGHCKVRSAVSDVTAALQQHLGIRVLKYWMGTAGWRPPGLQYNWAKNRTCLLQQFILIITCRSSWMSDYQMTTNLSNGVSWAWLGAKLYLSRCLRLSEYLSRWLRLSKYKISLYWAGRMLDINKHSCHETANKFD